MSHLAPDNEPVSSEPRGRRPVVFAGKRPEVLEQALGEPDAFFEALLIPAESSPPGRFGLFCDCCGHCGERCGERRDQPRGNISRTNLSC